MVQLLNANMISLKDPYLHWNVKTISTLLVVVSSLVRKNFNNNKDNNNNKIYLYCQVN